MKKTYYIFILVLLVLGGIYVGKYFIFSSTASMGNISPYFSYSDRELASLKGLSSKYSIESKDLYAWDQEVFKLVSKNNYPDTTASRIYAYLFNAQRDYAEISYALQGEYKGSIAPVSKKVLCVFFQSDCEIIDVSRVEDSYEIQDEYSNKLADIVMTKVHARLDEEQHLKKVFPRLEGLDYWVMSQPWIGYETASWKPWTLDSNNEFRAPNVYFNKDKELKETLFALNNITDTQKKAVVFWAGGPGTKTPPGIWIDIADKLLQRDQHVSVSKVLDVRTMTAVAAADAVIGVMDSKYTYWRKRPFMLDPTIRTIMPTPNHPSYPAGHSTISNAAATVLLYFFPNNIEEIKAQATEAGLSRIWGGIHFPMDHSEGVVLGNKVGQKVLFRMMKITQ